MDFIQTSNKQVDKFGAGKHGFSAGNPATGVLATFLSPEWHDDVQQELVNVIDAAGIAPAAATRNQLLQALRSAGVFETAPQFDATTKVATMQALQRALGNLASNVTVSVTGTLTAASAGVLHSLAPGAPITVTLPLRSTLNMGGETFPFVNISSVACTIATQGGDLIDTGTSSTTSLVLQPGEARMMSHATAGYAVIASHSPYVSVLAENGYHKLPGGLIVQWQAFNAAINSTTTVTLPVAFPNAFYGTVVTIRDNVANLATDPISTALPLTLSTFSLRSYYSGSNINNFCVSIGS